MMHPIFDWLPKHRNWAEAFAKASANPEATFEDLRSLSQHDIDFMETIRLDRLLCKKLTAPPAGLGTRPVRLAVLGSSTVEHLPPGIRVGALRKNLWTDIYTADYGQFYQELENPASAFHAFKPDAVLFSFHSEAVFGDGTNALSAAEADQTVNNALAQLRALWRHALAATNDRVIQQTFLPTSLALLGNNEHRLAWSQRRLVERLNGQLRDVVAESEGIDLLAIDSRAAIDGLSAWHDPLLWHHAKQLVSPAAAPFYGELVARLLAARQGRSAKCLVMDLDNTLWGGVIGDDGLQGIKLGQGSAIGEAFVAFQRYAKALSERGVILAVCSKNDEANALSPFEKHPDMVLKRSDIACFAANWEDKATNIRRIAQSINIGLDSLVFADDNPFERNIVRRELPMVNVPELPADPGLYARCIANAGYFEGIAVTADDLHRSQQYQQNFERESLRKSSTDLAGYLRSLSMRLIWSPFNTVGLQRVVQLINKSNQFNLTTRRYTEAEAIARMQDDQSVTLQLRLVDKFGDNGIIAVVIAKRDLADGNDFRIDTWLMSCRVLGRQVEEATLNLLTERVRAAGGIRLVGEYRPTEKNGIVRDHYVKLGFTRVAEEPDGSTLWQLTVTDIEPKLTYIEIVKNE